MNGRLQDRVTPVTGGESGIGAVVNCAGISADTPALETTVEQVDRIIAINLRGSFLIERESASAESSYVTGHVLHVDGGRLDA